MLVLDATVLCSAQFNHLNCAMNLRPHSRGDVDEVYSPLADVIP